MSGWRQAQLEIQTRGRSALDITAKVNQVIADSEITYGLAHVFLQHTSASLMLCENADPTVLSDLETIMQRIAPDADPDYQHNYEGDDDMAAHVRSVLTTNDLTLPIRGKHLALGTWQGVFLYEHRFHPHRRKIIVTIDGEVER